MTGAVKEQVMFVLEDDNEVMTTALDPDSDLDGENKQMNRELIREHRRIIEKLEKGEHLTQHGLQLIRGANEIHLNDSSNLAGHHEQAVELDHWLDLMTEMSAKKAFEILEKHLDKDSNTPAIVFRALHTLWEEITPNGVVDKSAFNDGGKCLKCDSKVSLADVRDTLVFVGDEIVKRHDGDISNRNCVRCVYPEQYPEYKHYEEW